MDFAVKPRNDSIHTFVVIPRLDRGIQLFGFEKR